jgi:hypothetical protein
MIHYSGNYFHWVVCDRCGCESPKTIGKEPRARDAAADMGWWAYGKRDLCPRCWTLEVPPLSARRYGEVVGEDAGRYCAPDKRKDPPGEGENHRMWRAPRVYPTE